MTEILPPAPPPPNMVTSCGFLQLTPYEVYREGDSNELEDCIYIHTDSIIEMRGGMAMRKGVAVAYTVISVSNRGNMSSRTVMETPKEIFTLIMNGAMPNGS